jgi:hypothetical protein
MRCHYVRNDSKKWRKRSAPTIESIFTGQARGGIPYGNGALNAAVWNIAVLHVQRRMSKI